MSFAKLERMILTEARTVLNNPKLRKADIMEWSTGDVKPDGDEVVVVLSTMGVQVCVKTRHDKRNPGA